MCFDYFSLLVCGCNDDFKDSSADGGDSGDADADGDGDTDTDADGDTDTDTDANGEDNRFETTDGTALVSENEIGGVVPV